MAVGRLALAVGVVLAMAFSVPSAATHAPQSAPKAPVATGWTTYHHDNTRDGYDPNAPAFSGGPFSSWDKTLDCEVFAEPLALSGVVYVATMCDSVYAFDVATGNQLWARTALATRSTATHCSMSGNVGIMSTPVIDPSTGILYAVGLVAGTPEKYRMWALHISDGTTVTNFPVDLSVNPQYQNQRAALALANAHVYVPFGGWIGDCGTYHPNIVSVPATGVAQDHQFQPATGCMNGAGMWGASGVAVDGSGNIYAASGNSTDDGSCMGATGYPCTNSSWDYGNGVFKLSSTLSLISSWAPDNATQNWCALNVSDTDIGSLGPALLPNNEVFQTGKSGYGWLLSQTFTSGFDTQQYQNQISTCSPDAVFGGVAYYAGRIYVPCDGVGLVAFSVNTTTHTFNPTADWVQAVDPGPPIAAMGLIWVRDQGGDNLYGFDPATGTQRVQAALGGGSNHFATPAEDGGWVFAGHSNHIRAFNFNPPPCASTTSAAWFSSCSALQYSLTGSDGSTWTDMDATTPLSVTFTPSVASYAVLSANTSLFTTHAGYNQDIGIAVTGGAFPTNSGQPEAWKESGGAKTFTPNAAYLQTVIPVGSGVQYTATLQWKSNVADPSSIWAGAGPIPSRGFSPTRLTAMLVPQSAGTVFSATSTQHYSLTGSNGSAWQDMDATNLSVQFTPPAGSWLAFAGGNADLWTQSAGYNQDLGIALSGGAYPTTAGQPEVWKESGGGGTYSPNAAFAQAPLAVAGGVTYTATLRWKANRADPGTIWAGAGPVNGAYSPTSVVVVLVPSTGGAGASSVHQYANASSDGSTWKAVDATNLSLSLSPSATTNYLFSGNADLFTQTAGYNQDLGIMVSGGSFGSGTVVSWEESGGGFSFSPDAAFAEADVSLASGSTYTITLVWKSNRAAPGVSIYAGAGPLGSAYSPTRLAASALP